MEWGVVIPKGALLLSPARRRWGKYTRQTIANMQGKKNWTVFWKRVDIWWFMWNIMLVWGVIVVLGRFLWLFGRCAAPAHIEMCRTQIFGRSGCSYRGATNNKEALLRPARKLTKWVIKGAAAPYGTVNKIKAYDGQQMKLTNWMFRRGRKDPQNWR